MDSADDTLRRTSLTKASSMLVGTGVDAKEAGLTEPAYPASVAMSMPMLQSGTELDALPQPIAHSESASTEALGKGGASELPSSAPGGATKVDHEMQRGLDAARTDAIIATGDALFTASRVVDDHSAAGHLLQAFEAGDDNQSTTPALPKANKRAKAEKEMEEEDQDDGWDWHCSSCGCLQPPETAVEACGEVPWSKQLLSCDGGCMKSFHIACLDMTTSERQAIIDSEDPWRCPTCMAGGHKCHICDCCDDPGYRPIMRWGDIESVSDASVINSRLQALWSEKQAAETGVEWEGDATQTAVSSVSASCTHLKWLTCPADTIQRLRLYTFIRRAACVDDRLAQLSLLSSICVSKRKDTPAANSMVHNILARGLKLHTNLSYSIEHGLSAEDAAALRAYLGLKEKSYNSTPSDGMIGSLAGAQQYTGSVPGAQYYAHEVEASYFPDATSVDDVAPSMLSLLCLAHLQECTRTPGTASLLHDWFGDPEGKMRTSHAILNKLEACFEESTDETCSLSDLKGLLQRWHRPQDHSTGTSAGTSGFDNLTRSDPCVCCPLPLAGAPINLLGAKWTGVRKCRHDKCGKYYHYSCLRRLADDAVADADVRRVLRHSSLNTDIDTAPSTAAEGKLPIPVYVSVASAIESGYFDKWLEAADQFMKECLHFISSTWRNKPMPQSSIISTELSALGVSLYGRVRKRVEALGGNQSDSPFQDASASSTYSSKKKSKKKRNVNIGAAIPAILSPELILVVLAGSSHPTIPDTVLQLLEAGDIPSLEDVTQADEDDAEGYRHLPGLVTNMTGIECLWVAPSVSSDFLCPRHFCDACEGSDVGVASELFPVLYQHDGFDPVVNGGPASLVGDTALWLENTRRKGLGSTIDGLHLPDLYPLVLLDATGVELGAAPPPCPVLEVKGEEEEKGDPVSLKELLDSVSPLARALLGQPQGFDNSVTIVSSARSRLIRRLLKKMGHVKCCWLCPCAYHERCLPDDAFLGDHTMLCHFHPKAVARLVEKGEDGPLPLIKASSFFAVQPTFTQTSIIGLKIGRLPTHPTAPQICDEDDERHFWCVPVLSHILNVRVM